MSILSGRPQTSFRAAAVAAIATLAVTAAASVVSAEVGEAAFPSIALAPAARPGGLAGAHAAAGADLAALGINPAGLAQGAGDAFSGSVRPAVTRAGAAGYAFDAPWAFGGRMAVAVTYVDFDAIPGTDEEGNPTGTVRPYNLYPSLTWARTFAEGFRAGATVKFARESLGEYEGSTPALGAAVDAGVQYRFTPSGLGALALGASVTNAGRQFTGYSETDTRRGDLPAAARVGAAYEPRTQRALTLVADAEFPLHAPAAVSAGAEYRLLPEWEVRGGTRWSREDVRNLLGWIDPNAGIEERGGEALKLAGGTTLRVGGVAVDYAAQWWRGLGLVHALSVTWSPAAP